MMFPLHKVEKTLSEKPSVCATTVVFIHGNSAHSGTWQHQLNSGMLQDYPMVAFDLPGHGESPRSKSYSLSQTVKMLVENCKAFHRVVLVGHSLGGHLAIEALTELRNGCGLMIFGTPPVKKPLNLQEAFLPDDRIALLFKGPLDAAEKERFVQGICNETSPAYRTLMHSLSDTDPKFREDMGTSLANGEFSDESEILANVKLPVAICHGMDDALVNAVYIEGLEIPYLWQQKMHYVENSTHSPHIENPPRFNQLLSQFLKDLP